MSTPSVATDLSMEALVGQVADEFVQRLNRGEQPDIEDYARRHPEIDGVLRQVLAALELARIPGEDVAAEVGGIAGTLARGCLGDFRIVREVGRGGMGVVYEAEQISLNRKVALKVLPFAAAMDPKQLQRFKNEAQAAGQLHHQHIVPVYGVGCERGVHYYAMQYIEGQTLAAAIHQLRAEWDGLNPAGANRAPRETCPSLASPHEVTPPAGVLSTEGSTRHPGYFRTVAQLGVQAAEALEHAHQMGIVHRDIKPANVMVDGRGNLWITDFGLARVQSDAGLTMSGDLLGTLRYMSPEQALAKHGLVDHRTDLYALGATLYELLTLQPACPGEGRLEVLRQIEREEPRPPRSLNPAVPADLETIVLKALAKEPEGRYASATELAEDLERFLDNKPIRAKRPTLWQRTRKWCGRHQGMVVTSAVAVVLVLVTVITALAVGIRRVQDEQREADKARQAAVDSRERAEESFRQAHDALEKALRKVAEDPRLQRGDLEDLRRMVRQAEAQFYQQFVQLRGEEPGFRWEQAQAYAKLAQLTAELKSRQEAVDVYRQAVSVLAVLVRDNPSVAKYQILLAQYQHNVGVMCIALGRWDEAESALREALAIRETVARNHAGAGVAQRDLAKIHGSLAIVYRKTNRPAEAEQAYQVSLALRRQLVHDHPLVLDYQSELATLCQNLGYLYLHTQRYEKAEPVLLEALALRKSLIDANPRNLSYRFGMAKAQNFLGILYMLGNRVPEAETAYQEALRILETLRREHPQNTGYALELGNAERNRGSLATRTGQTEASLAWQTRAVETLEAVLDKEPNNADAQRWLGRANDEKFHALEALSRRDEALEVLNHWMKRLAGAPRTAVVRLEMAKTLARLKRHAEATAEASDLLRLEAMDAAMRVRLAELYSLACAAARDDDPARAEQYAAQAMELLQQAVAQGYKDATELKTDKDLDSVRQRPDFQELLNDLDMSLPLQ